MIEEFTPQLVTLIVFWVTVLATAMTLPTSWVLLRRYRRAVLRAMSSAAAAQDIAPAPSAVTVSAPDRVEPRCAARLGRDVLRDPWRCAARYALAGLTFASTLAVGSMVLLRVLVHPFYFLLLVWVFAWPVVLMVNWVVAFGWRMRSTTALAYFGALAGLGLLASRVPNVGATDLGAFRLPAFSTVTPLGLVQLWSLFNLLPTVLLLAFFIRRVRAVGPLVLSFMTVAVTGSTLTFWGMFYRGVAERVIAAAVKLHVSVLWILFGGATLAFVAFGGLGWLLAVWIRRGYQRKTISDQSLTLDAVWLLFGATGSIGLVLGGPLLALTGVLAFLVYKLTVRLSLRLLPPLAESGRDCTALLFLRVFSLGKRSELLFDAIAKHWRHVGSVQFITGPDLATSTVEPHQFLEFLTGKLSQLFIGSQEALERRMQLLDVRPDADGRFRINHFFCRSDTWQSVMARLVRDSNAVLMDLRSFSPKNAGCIVEIKELIDVAPLGKLVLVIDKTTDRAFLDETLDQAWQSMHPASPNRETPRAALQPFHLESLGAPERRRLLRRLCSAATISP
jgi:hypothetical protein